jgi:5-methylcytosine-specific restriction protein A
MSGWKHDRRSRQARGYGKEWDRIRPVILKRDTYLCRCDDCERDGTIKPATQVDHRISKADWLRRFGNLDRVDDPSNLRAINAKCHERKSLREKGLTVRSGADASGLPTDPGHPWNLGARGGMVEVKVGTCSGPAAPVSFHRRDMQTGGRRG